MRSMVLTAAVAVVGVGVAGCGGGSGSSGTTHRAAVPASKSRPTQVFRVQMSGAVEVPPGARHGVGAAVIAFHGTSMVCWRFAHLHGFTSASTARVEHAVSARARQTVLALSSGHRLRHQGCVGLNPALTSQIMARPRDYVVSIESRQYPHGAVGAQL